MKFRDKKTGEVLDDIDVVRKDFCRGRPSCAACPFDCGKFVREHPYEAAPLLDCEVIDDTPTDTPTTLDDTPTGSGDRPTKEDNMDKQDKPLSEWTLGEINQMCKRQTECKACILLNKNGTSCKLAGPASFWKLEEKPHLTEPEIAIMRAVGAKWVSRNINNGVDCAVNCAAVYLWREKPSSSIGLYFADGGPIATVNDPDLFPSVKPGDLIEYEKEKTK